MPNQPRNQINSLKANLLTALFFAVGLTTFSQVGIGTTSPKAALDVVSTDAGFLMPRIVDHTALSVSADQQGMQVYDMTTNSVWLYSGTSWEETESAVVPLWQSESGDGSYTTNDIVNYNGVLYKSLTGVNTDIDPTLDTTNWTKHAATLVSDTDGDTSVETERSTDDDKVYVKTNGIDRLTTSSSGTISRGNIKINNGQFSSLNYLDIGFNGSNGIAKFKAIGNGNSSAEFYTSNSGTSTLALRIEENQNITVSKDLSADTFSTAWINATNGGVYDPNHIAIYEGSLYKNITGTNSNTTPDSDAANWKNITGVSSLEAKSMIEAQDYDVTSNTFDGEWELFYSVTESQLYIRNVASDISINGDVGYFVSNNGTLAVSPKALSLTQYVWSTLWTDVSLGYTSNGSREWVQFTDALGREYLFKTTLGATKVLMDFQRIK